MVKRKQLHNITLYTSYYGNYDKIPAEYQCVSISHTKPQGIGVPVWESVAPPWALIRALKEQEIDMRSFARTYISILSSREPQQYIDYLSKYSLPVVLLCWEKPYTSCHRSLLAAFLWYKCGVYSSELDSFDVMMGKEQFESFL